jgi:hypothetical protein
LVEQIGSEGPDLLQICQGIGEAKTGHGIVHGRCCLAQQGSEPGLIALEQDEGFRIVFQQQPGQLVQQGASSAG